MSKLPTLLAVCALAASLALPAPGRACGGFFCSAAPVDQNAERILFAIDETTETTDMVVQITYQGDDDAFAWLLPVGEVPSHRAVISSSALAPLDAQTGPQFQLHDECRGGIWLLGGGPVFAGATTDLDEAAPPPVVIHVQETVGPFDVVVLESADANATFTWLVDNGYRLSQVMKPYIELYTQEGMKFLALKLTADATAKDIQPFKMTFSGTTPSVPLRLTAVAAEPEMGIVVWILANQRYQPANASELEIADEDLRWKPDFLGFNPETNWTQLVARAVDENGGRGWVVEQAGSTDEVRSFLENTATQDEEQEEARQDLLALFEGKSYLTRLYTRVSPEEMSYDPVFRRSDKDDVPRTRQLPYIEELCDFEREPPPWTPCDFAACGQLGLCLPVDTPDVVACACAPGSTARTTFDPAGAATVACQDQRMSFMNPGEKDETGATFPDPCVGFDCGEHGRCIAMNLTPTCECEQGYVAVGRLGAEGMRETSCVKPTKEVPKTFYNRRPPQLAAGMVAGRTVSTEPATEPADRPMPDTYGDPRPADDPNGGGTGSETGTPNGSGTPPGGNGMNGGAQAEDDSGCALGRSPSARGAEIWLWLAAGWFVLRRRKHA